MASHKTPPGSLKRTSRNISHPLPRRQTRGPLDADESLPVATSPPSNTTTAPAPAPAPKPELAPPSPLPAHEPKTRSPSPARPTPSTPSLTFLQTPHLYHPLPPSTTSPAQPFLTSPHAPSPSTPLPALLSHGHYRHAATQAAQTLCTLPAASSPQILHLYQLRLHLLVLLQRPDLALAESRSLSEALAHPSLSSRELAKLVPWDLRVLLVRLQTLGSDPADGDAGGARRCVMGLYVLAHEAREGCRAAKAEGKAAGLELWATRLRDLGLRVVDALVEMGELETAGRQLESLGEGQGLVYRRALLRVRVGDVQGARALGEGCGGLDAEVLNALLETADAEPGAAVPVWRALVEKYPGNEMLAQNLAVCLVYGNRIQEARELLEGLLVGEGGRVFGTGLFNLATVFELCTERAGEEKMRVAERLAGRETGVECGGWERGVGELKL